MTSPTFEPASLSRRDFVKASALATGAVALSSTARAHTPSDEIRVGVVGCGGRGTGAAVDSLTASEKTRVVALGDTFQDRVESCRTHLAEQGPRATVAPERCFVGFDAYTKVIEAGVDLVILATAPGFRPLHLAAAIAAGKHVFLEKPCAVDPAGVRSVLESSRLAASKKLAIVAGTQRRHEASYLAAMKQVQSGSLGTIVSARCSWTQGGLWVKERDPKWSDVEWQVRNWLYFTWLSGDHIVEQHVHNIDVVNWALGAHPVRAVGYGGRQVRTEAKYGHVYDHFAIDFEYPNGVHVLSTARQIDNCHNAVEETIVGTKGSMNLRPGYARFDPLPAQKGEAWTFDEDEPNPYVAEHQDLIASIEMGRPLNEGERLAESTLSAIMGRMSAYTGKEVAWEQALNSKLDLVPRDIGFGPLPVAEVAMPGRTAFV